MNADMQLDATRDVVRCARCGLMQYLTANGRCRKCRMPFFPEAAPAATPEAAAPPLPPAFSVGIPLRRIRTERGLSQGQVAALLNTSRTYISKIENGGSGSWTCIPTLGSLERLAEALCVSPGDLVEDEIGRRAREVAEVVDDPFLAEIAEALPNLDRAQRGWLLAEAQKLAEKNERRAARKVREHAAYSW